MQTIYLFQNVNQHQGIVSTPPSIDGIDADHGDIAIISGHTMHEDDNKLRDKDETRNIIKKTNHAKKNKVFMIHLI